MKDITQHSKVISTLVDFSNQDRDLLQEEIEQIVEWIPEMVQEFYDTLFACEETKLVFKNSERAHLEKTLTAWIFDIISGYEDTEFWEYQWVIALVHIRKNVKNIYVVGMMNRLQQVVLEKCRQTYDIDKALQVYSAFLRITGISTALIIECYTELQEHITEEGLNTVGVRRGIVKRIRERKLNSMMEEMLGSRKIDQPEKPQKVQ